MTQTPTLPDPLACNCQERAEATRMLLLSNAKALRDNAHELHQQALKLQHEAIGFEKAAHEIASVYVLQPKRS